MAKSKQKSDSGKVYSGLFADYMEKMVNWHLSMRHIIINKNKERLGFAFYISV